MGDEHGPLQSSGRRACPVCGAAFTCGILAGADRCWCADVQPVLPVPLAAAGAECLCPTCLRAAAESAGTRLPVVQLTSKRSQQER